jgi:hypothetical protein
MLNLSSFEMAQFNAWLFSSRPCLRWLSVSNGRLAG